MSRLLPFAAFVLALGLAGAAGAAEDGAKLFADNCSACHQPAGQGIPGAFPALAGNAFVQGPPSDPAAVVLNGRGGMPSFRNDLDDDRIAAILSYVRSSWGNRAGPIAPSDVASARTSARSEDAAAALQAH